MRIFFVIVVTVAMKELYAHFCFLLSYLALTFEFMFM